MHELSIAEGIIEIVERTANANHVRHVKTVRVSIGELAGVDIPSLEFAWCVRAALPKTQNLKLNGQTAKLGVFNAKKPFRFTATAIPAPTAAAISLPRREERKCA